MPLPQLNTQPMDFSGPLTALANKRQYELGKERNILSREQGSREQERLEISQQIAKDARARVKLDFIEKMADAAIPHLEDIKDYDDFKDKIDRLAGDDIPKEFLGMVFPEKIETKEGFKRWKNVAVEFAKSPEERKAEVGRKLQKEVQVLKEMGELAKEKVKQKGQTEREKIKQEAQEDKLEKEYDLKKDLETHKKGIKAPEKLEKEKKSDLKEMRNDYFKTVGRASSALRGVGEYVKNKNSEQVAKDEFKRANNIAIEYYKQGGKLEKLGIDGKDLFESAENVKEMFRNGELTEDQSAKALIEFFGMTE